MKLQNMKALSSFFILLILTGCTIHQELLLTQQAKKAEDETQVNWYGADVRLLPIFNNSRALARIAEELCTPSAPFGQKVYAMQLATQALALDKKTKGNAALLARTAFYVADCLDTDEDKMKKSADIGVKAARVAGINESSPETCFYFALNQGLIVRTKGLFALNKLPEIHQALKISQKVESLESGGPLRVLGMMYLKAPAWPSGIGDLDKALELIEKATVNYPEHPQNFMFYAEALIEDDNKVKALQCLETANKLATPEIWGVYYSKKWRSEIELLKKKIEK
jgi:tetratricopeptide (TPR) repeat protein